MPSNFFTDFAVAKDSVFNTGVGAIKKIADPFLTGYAFAKFFPGQLLDREIGLDPLFFELMEKTIKEVAGLPRVELSTASIQGGFTQNEHMYPNEITKNMTEVTLRFQELTGTPYMRSFRRWVESIRDPETGLYKLSKYGLKYYSVSMLYINTNASIGSHFAETRKESVEAAFLMTGMFPKVIDFDKFNYNSGDHSVNETEQPFSCNIHWGSAIMDRAKAHVADEKFYESIRKASQNIYDDGNDITNSYVSKNKTGAEIPFNTTGTAPINPNIVVVPEF